MKHLVAFALLALNAAAAQPVDVPDLDALRETRRAHDSTRERDARARLDAALAQLQAVRAGARGDDQRLAQLQARHAQLRAQAQRQRELLALRQEEVRDLYTTARQAAGDLVATLRLHATAPPSPALEESLRALAANPRPLSLDNLAALWESMHEVLTHTATQSRATDPVQTGLAQLAPHTVTRLGTVAAIADGRHARFDPVAGVYRLRPPGPAPVQRLLARLDEAEQGVVDIALLLSEAPVATAPPRLRAAGPVGVVIVALGALGTAVLGLRALIVLRTHRAERLGRADRPTARLATARDLHGDERSESLAGWINAAVRREVRRLFWGHAALQVIIAAAPLLGLLGTVTGMIVMFEQLRIYGGGDPVLMAGGIAQALSTTWLGLVVALPLLLGQRAVVALANGLVRRLDREAVAFVAAASTQR